MIYSQEFLRELDSQKNRIIYARITALRFDESPIETIEGRATGGSINIDGASAVRRTCSITIVADNYDYRNYYWGLNTKFKLEIGVANYVDSNEPDIIWFPQGIYLITSFNTSRSTSNFTISISGKDKMCLLNGEVSGNLEAQVDFGTIEEEDKDGTWVKRKIPIVDIIKNAVHVYGSEPLHNIIINDLPEYGLELLEYRYDLPMYLYREWNNNLYDNALIDGDKLCRIGDPEEPPIDESALKALPIVALKDLKSENLDLLIDDLMGVDEPTPIYFDDNIIPYRVAKIEYGQTAGYRKTDLVYAGDLVANVGENLVSVLDKIKNMLGEFEYFYDVDGRFIFQQKRTYVNIPWTFIKKDNSEESAITVALAESSMTAYTFNDGELITQFNNNPNIMNAKNDYVIRGERTGISGSILPVLLRYAIDSKPISYTTITLEAADLQKIDDYNLKYNTTLTYPDSQRTFIADDGPFTVEESIIKCDWREVIYQMARDYYKYNWLESFELRVAKANELYPTGRTGYEQYYLDLGSFWRDLYYPQPLMQEEIDKITPKLNTVTELANGLTEFINNSQPGIITTAQNNLQRAPYYDTSLGKEVSVQEAYITLLAEKAELEIAKIELEYNLQLQENYNAQLELLNKKSENFINDPKYNEIGWHRDVFDHPELLNFWFDFLDTEGELSNFSVKAIGSRAKAIHDSSIKGIYFRDTPDLFFVSSMSNADNSNTAYRYVQVPSQEMEEMFSISAQGKSAKIKLDELVNQHGYCAESATITAIPIYHLDSNTRIHLHDEDTHLDGDYIVSKITLPLTYNGTMSITATKAPQNLL